MNGRNEITIRWFPSINMKGNTDGVDIQVIDENNGHMRLVLHLQRGDTLRPEAEGWTIIRAITRIIEEHVP